MASGRRCCLCYGLKGDFSVKRGQLAHIDSNPSNCLIDNIAYHRGITFLTNPAETTDVVPRYGRELSVRTLFQVPYVHLYEWTLLMDFIEARFEHLPWEISEDPSALGRDVRDEIEEALDLISDYARPTAAGHVVRQHLKCLFDEADRRWRSLR